MRSLLLCTLAFIFTASSYAQFDDRNHDRNNGWNNDRNNSWGNDRNYDRRNPDSVIEKKIQVLNALVARGDHRALNLDTKIRVIQSLDSIAQAMRVANDWDYGNDYAAPPIIPVRPVAPAPVAPFRPEPPRFEQGCAILSGTYGANAGAPQDGRYTMIFQSKCSGLTSCMMRINNDLFGGDPKPGVVKCAEVVYRDGPGPNKVARACEKDYLSLTCSQGTFR